MINNGSSFWGLTRDKSKVKDEANTNRVSLERASLDPANLEYAKSLNISKLEKNTSYLIREISLRISESKKDFRFHYLHFGVMTRYTVFLLDMDDGAYREYLTLWNRTAALNASFQIIKNKSKPHIPFPL